MTFTSRSTFATLALTALLGSALSTGALAHAHLVSSVPADKAMAMPAPKELTLTFTEGLELKLSKVVVKGPDKAPVSTGAPHLAPSNDKVLVVPMPASVPDGTYTVEWTAVAKDGHKTNGHYSFDAMQ